MRLLGDFGAKKVLAPTHQQLDLRRADDIRAFLRCETPDVIVHLAAVVGGIGANRKNPGRFFYENLIMGVELMEQARLNGVSKMVVAGTICAYPKFTPVPFKEDALWNGYPEETNAPYGLAKKMLLVQCQAYREQYGFNGVFVLPVNMYGPEDNFDLETSHVIPAIIRKVHEAQERGEDVVMLWGDGSPTREFIHARDAARGILTAADVYNESEAVNIGSGQEIAIRELAAMIVREMRYTGRIAWDPSQPNGQPRRALDVTRAQEKFGFEAKIPLHQGIAETVAWYRAQVHPAPAGAQLES
jgi:GDP-L-fucose synthase